MDYNVNYKENRFGYFKQMNDEDILKVKAELEKEIADYEVDLDDTTISNAQKSEIRNSDLPYAREQLEYVNIIVDERGLIPKL